MDAPRGHRVDFRVAARCAGLVFYAMSALALAAGRTDAGSRWPYDALHPVPRPRARSAGCDGAMGRATAASRPAAAMARLGAGHLLRDPPAGRGCAAKLV